MLFNSICAFTEYTKSALEILRKPQATMQWYIIPILLIVLYIVSNEISKKNWNVLLGAVALWGMDLFNEIWNSIVCFSTGFAPVWGTPVVGSGNTSLLLLIGYNVEISFMFLLMGISFCMLLPEDKKQKILGINNRVLIAIVMTFFCVLVECFLNKAGILTWEYNWWSCKNPYLIYLIGYLPFFTMATIVHDLPRKKQYITVASILGFDLLLLIIFGAIGWM